MTIAGLVVAIFLQVTTAARIGNVAGQAELTRPAETVIARNGDLVADGDRLHTLKDASLSLLTEFGVTLQLKADSRLEMKKASGEPLVFLTEGSIGVKTPGKPVRIETKYGQIIAVEDSNEFEVKYNGDAVYVLVIRGSITAEASQPSKILFRSAADLGTRTYEAGSILPTEPVTRGERSVIVYPQVENPAPRVVGPNDLGKRPIPAPPTVIPK